MGAASSSNLPSTTLLARTDSMINTDSNNRKSSRNIASTIKKRFKKTRRFKQLDYGKILKDFLSTWSTDNLIQLVNDYETSSIIKDYYLQAEMARSTVSSISQDLKKLYDTNETADVYLMFKERQFPVHKSIVCARCPLFRKRELLGKVYTFGTVVPIEIDIPEITADLFSNLLRYLYTGEIQSDSSDELNSINFKNLFENLSKHVPNNLDFDLKHLLDTGIYSDVKLVFKNSTQSTAFNHRDKSNDKCNHNSSTNLTYNLNTPTTKNLTYNSTSILNHSPSKSIKQSSISSNVVKCVACSNQSEFSVHAAILSSRSRFFRNLILKYQAKNCLTSMENQNVNTSKQSIRIVLDEEYIKRRYINIVLDVIYCDGTNILNLLPNCICRCKTTTNSLTNLTANLTNLDCLETNSFNTQTIFQTISNTISPADHQTTTINRAENFIDEIIDLFVIGKFLELEMLTSICENLLADAINLDTVFRLLDWSEKSSEFVKRQCMCFLREEFSTIATSQFFLQLNENQLIELIRSDFLQASEDEVLRAILKWIKFKMNQDFNDQTNSKCLIKNLFNSSYSNGSTKLNNSNSNLSFNSNESPRKRQTEYQDQMKELIGRLIKHLRIAHILPLENDLLKNALKNELNELISTLPPYMLNDDQTLSYERGIMAWINLENRTNFVKPRFFQPFYEEAKSILDERLSRNEEINFNEKISPKKPSFSMPDNLYMVDDELSNSINKMNFNNSINTNSNSTIADLDLNPDRKMIKNLKEKFLTNRFQIDMDYLDKDTKNLIRQKSTENYTKILPTIKSLNLEEKYEILIYIQLKVLRESNLPDEMLFIFEQDEPDYVAREKVFLNINLKRRSLNKNRKFSINSIDLENYFANDPINEQIGNQEKTLDKDNFLNRENSFNKLDVKLNQSDLQKCDQSFDQNHINQDNLQISHINSFNQLGTYDQSSFSQDQMKSDPLNEKEISLDVFI